MSPFDTHNANIVPQLSPTMPRPLSLAFSDNSLDDGVSPYEDDDTTEGHNTSRYSDRHRSGTWSSYQYLHGSESSNVSAAPSLSHTPSSSVASIASMAAPRALPSRHNKSYSAYSIASVDLVTPCRVPNPSIPAGLDDDESMQSSVRTLTAVPRADGVDSLYERRPTRDGSSAAESSLKQLFSHDAVKAPPPKVKSLSSGQD